MVISVKFFPSVHNCIQIADCVLPRLSTDACLFLGFELTNHVAAYRSQTIFGEEDPEQLSIQNVDTGKVTQKENDIISFLSGYVCSTLARRIRNSKTSKSKQNQDSMSILIEVKSRGAGGGGGWGGGGYLQFRHPRGGGGGMSPLTSPTRGDGGGGGDFLILPDVINPLTANGYICSHKTVCSDNTLYMSYYKLVYLY